jgi:hypothetical protein
MTEIVKHEGQAPSVFSNTQSFEHAQRIAKMLSSSNLVPTDYRGNMANTLVALEMANRVGASPLAVMQNMYVIEGRPSWSSSFIIAALNSCGRYEPLRFEVEDLGKKEITYDVWEGPKGQRQKRQAKATIDDKACYAWTMDKSGHRLEGPKITISMAVAEGWYTKPGSKWVTMPELMLRYRAAAFFGRLYAPELLMGMQTTEEVNDVTYTHEATSTNASYEAPTTIEKLNKFAKELRSTDEVQEAEVIQSDSSAVNEAAESPVSQDDDLI